MPPEQQQKPSGVSLSAVLAIAILVGALGFGGGLMMGAKTYAGGPVIFAADGTPPVGVDLSPVWKAWKVIDERFVPASVSTTTLEAASTTDVTQERIWGMIQGLAASTNDPYTYFLPPVEQQQFEDDMSGAFEGVGMEIEVREQVLTVVAPLKNTPAERAGLLAGDRILEIDGEDTRGLDVASAVERIRGPKGSTVKLLVFRDGWAEPREIDVVRDVINVPVITTEMRPDGVFVIHLATFTANAPSLFRGALREFIDSGSSRLILDVRDNPGGYLDGAVDMASWFLPSGRIVVVEDYAGHQDNIEHRSRGYDIFNDNLKMVVLVNRGSASASEILALALRSHGKATIIGTPTFGKGSVQELIEITADTALKMTVARWLGPNGEHIPHSGIVPDIEIEESTEEEGGEAQDTALERAAAFLLER